MTIRRIIYQGVVITTATIGAVAPTTPKTSGIQNFDQVRFATPFKAAREAFSSSFTSSSQVITPPIQDTSPKFRTGAFKPSLWYGEINTPSGTYVVANTPNTAGLQNFDWAFKKAFKATLQQHEINTPSGTYVPAGTPSNGVQSFFDTKASAAGKWLIADFSGAVNSPDQITFSLQAFDCLTPRRRLLLDTNVFAPTPISMAVTPITAGAQDFDFILFKRPFKSSLQQFTPFAPFSVSTGTATPTTAGLQNFDWLFQKPFKASLQQHEIITPPGTYIVANTPITGGIQGFDFAYKKSFSASLQALGTWGASVIIVASTPSSFQFASLDMQALRKWYPAYQQQFVAAQMLGDVPAPPLVTEVHNFPFIANVGTMMQRW